MCIQPTTLAAVEQQQFGKLSAAKLLGPQERQALAVDALAGTQSISQLAEDRDVSRKFDRWVLREHVLQAEIRTTWL